jgi:hypothetical protein
VPFDGATGDEVLRGLLEKTRVVNWPMTRWVLVLIINSSLIY